MRGVKLTAIALIMAVGLLLAIPTIDAVTVNSDNSYSSTDSVMPVDDGGARFYDIEATKDENIEYSVKVIGAGTVQVYLAKGDVSYFSIQMEYYQFYSEDQNSREVEKTMPVFSGEGNTFTLVVITEEDTSVTYDISIQVFEDEISDTEFMIICSAVIIIIVVVIVLILIWVIRKDKVKRQATAQQPIQSVQPQYASTAQQLYGGTDTYSQTPPPAPQPPPPPQYPGYPPQQPRQPY
jgi:hypothetical protein